MPGYLLTVHKYAPICTTPEQVFNYWFPYLIQPTLLFKLSYPPDIVPREAAGRSALPLEMFQDTLHLSDNSQCILCHLQQGFKTVACNRWLIWRHEFDFCFLSAISPAPPFMTTPILAKVPIFGPDRFQFFCGRKWQHFGKLLCSQYTSSLLSTTSTFAQK